MIHTMTAVDRLVTVLVATEIVPLLCAVATMTIPVTDMAEPLLLLPELVVRLWMIILLLEDPIRMMDTRHPEEDTVCHLQHTQMIHI